MTDQPPATVPTKVSPPIILHMHTVEPASMVTITPKGFHEDDFDGLPWLAIVYYYPATGRDHDCPEHWEWELVPPDGPPLTGVAMSDPAGFLIDLIQKAWDGTPKP